MTTPFDMIGQKELAPTCTAIADAGGTSEHAAWMRKPGNAATLVAFIDSQMGAITTLRVELYENERERDLCGRRHGLPCWAPNPERVQHGLLCEIWPELAPPPSVEALLSPYMITGVGNDYDKNGRSLRVPLEDEEGFREEGFFFVAKLSAIARIITGEKGMPDYNRVLRRIMLMLGERNPSFKDWTEGGHGPEFERPLEVWWKRRMAYEATVQGDFVAYVGQTGIAYRNWSVRAARAHMEQGRRRVGMTSVDVAQILLLHEERLMVPERLGMNCAGTESVFYRGKSFDSAPWFYCYRRGLSLASRPVMQRSLGSGSASFRLPEAK